jgi:hypothetical protein
MKIYGIDFTSSPKRTKPITCLECLLDNDRLEAGNLAEWQDFRGFEAALARPGPWIAGLDFPFGQSRTFIENIGWPAFWKDYVEYARTLGRHGFRSALDDYRTHRPPGDREHRRITDIAAGAISPQKLYGTPVGLMFFEGAPRIQEAGVTIPGLQQGDPDRIVVESYPGILARALIGRRPYKQDTRKKQTDDQHAARQEILRKITDNSTLQEPYGLKVQAPQTLADDPGGDHLDTLLCAIQAAWAWLHRNHNFGAPDPVDALEGWIADPTLRTPQGTSD